MADSCNDCISLVAWISSLEAELSRTGHARYLAACCQIHTVCHLPARSGASRPRYGVHTGIIKTKKTKLHCLSPRANYTDRATAALVS
jgi:hypothetical protein